MDHHLRELERRARLDPSLRSALLRARRRASLPPLDVPGIVAEVQRLEADLHAARADCAQVHARLLEPLLRALFDEEPALDVLVASWAGLGQGGDAFVHVALDGPEVLSAAGPVALRGTRADRPDVHGKCLPWTFNQLDPDARDRVRSDVLAFAAHLAARDDGHGQLLARRLRSGEVALEAAPTWRRWSSVLPQAVRDAARAIDPEVRALALAEVGARAVARDDLLPAPAPRRRAGRRERARPVEGRASELVGEVLEAQDVFAARRADTLAAAEDALARLGPALFERHPSLTHVAIVPDGRTGRVVATPRDLRQVGALLRDHGLDDLGLATLAAAGGERSAVVQALEPLAHLLAPTLRRGLLVLERLGPGRASVRRGAWVA